MMDSSSIINPKRFFFPIDNSNLLLGSMKILFCLLFSFVLAKHTHSPLNIMEWIWILLGSAFFNILLVPFAILCILGFSHLWLRYVYTIILAFIASTTSMGISSWNSKQAVLAVDSETITQLIGVWLLGVFFFLHTFELPQKPMKIRRGES